MRNLIPRDRFENGRLIITNYPPGGGGKFIANMIGLSRYCVLKKQEWARWQLDYQGPFDDKFYQTKLNWILETIPDKVGITWLAHELSDSAFYGVMPNDYSKSTANDFDPLIKEINDKGIDTVISAHNHGWSQTCAEIWKNVRIVSLYPSWKFAEKFLPQKNPVLYQQIGKVDFSWTDQSETLTYQGARSMPAENVFEVDIDNLIWSRDKFLKQIETLYQWLRYDDFNELYIGTFYDAYMSIHQP